MTHSPSRVARSNDEWEAGPDAVVLGVDIIELVSSSMYVDPLTTYREYVQNAADAIDDARALGLLPPGDHGRIDISIDTATRSVRIRDNGVGLSGTDFVRRLTAFGASDKRGRDRRGFRGVGRLAGLGYCQELLFRSRTAAKEPVRELRWNCRELRSLLRSGDYHGSLAEAVQRSTAHRSYSKADLPNRFFEVELRSVVRHGRDDLLSESAVRAYLGQVAPVAFSRSFPHQEELEAFLADVIRPPDLHIFVNGVGPVQRPHLDAIPMRESVRSLGRELALVTIPSIDGGPAAKGWVLHHDYLGAIPRELGVRGLRLRRGNIQVGDETTLSDLFAEPRFNAWAVGEFHILDPRIVPNGRRDQFEQSVHLANVLNHLTPAAREIAARCRGQSQYRQRLRNADIFEAKISGGLAVLRQGAISATARRVLVANLEQTLQKFGHECQAPMLSNTDRKALTGRHAVLRRRLKRAASRSRSSAALSRLNAPKRRAYEEIFSLIFECAPDVRGAKELVARVLARVEARGHRAAAATRRAPQT